jgi:heat shock protein HslJ
MKALKIILAAVILLGGILALNACQTLNPPLEDYSWVLTSWTENGNAKTLLPDAQITAFFSSQDHTVSGSSGCNSYRGTFQVEGLTLTINKDIIMTEMYCSDAVNQQESQYLNALKAAASYKLDHGNLIIYYGSSMLKFTRENGSTKTISQWGE